VAKLLSLIEAMDLRNISIHAGDARELFEHLPDGSLERIYLLYPDPWPKTRHHRRRLVCAENLRHFHRLLKPGGFFLFASDIAHYVQWTLFEMRMAGGFTWLAESAADWRKPFPEWIETRYEAKARRAGRVPSYLTFRRD
jgi:tRNA (guanine-N7-)-methyltransferase